MSRRKNSHLHGLLAPIFLTTILLVGCYAPYSKQVLPMRLYSEEQAHARGLSLEDRVEMTGSGFRLFTWPLDMPSSVDLIEDLITRHQAQGIANLEVDFHEWTILQIISFPSVTVSGNLVLRKGGTE